MSTNAMAEAGRLLAASIERILRDLCPASLVREADLATAGGGAPGAADALVAALHAAGFDAALVDESGGGAGLGWAGVRAAIEACGRWAAPVPLPDTMAAQALARLAGTSLSPGWAAIASGRLSHGRILVEGVACWPQARALLLSIAQDDRGEGVAVWSFPLGVATTSAAAGAVPRGLNVAGEPRAAIELDPALGARIGTIDGAIEALHVGAAVRCAQIAGACDRVVTISADYARARIQFGRPIAAFQAIQQELALAQQWSSMASAASALALSGETVVLDATRVAAAKHVCGEAAAVCARVAHAVHGAIGVTAEYDLQLLTRRLWSWSTEFGSSTYWATQLGAGLLADGEARSWDEVVRHSGG